MQIMTIYNIKYSVSNNKILILSKETQINFQIEIFCMMLRLSD